MNYLNQPQNLEQFNLLQQKRFHDNLVGDLTNWRPLGGSYESKSSVILQGYYKQILMIDKMLVRTSKQVVAQ